MFDAGSVVGRMVLDTSSFDTSVVNVNKQTQILRVRMQAMGQDVLSSAGKLKIMSTQLIFAGASILAPFVLAVNQASKSNWELGNRLQALNTITKEFTNEIANRTVVWLDRLYVLVNNLNNGFKNLSPAVKQLIVDFTLLSGIVLIVTGIGMKIWRAFQVIKGAFLIGSAAVLSFFETIALLAMYHPIAAAIIAIVGAIALLIVDTKYFGNVIKDILGAVATTAVYGLLGAWDTFCSYFYKTISAILGYIAKIPFLPNAMKQWLLEASNTMNEVSASFSASASADTQIWLNAWANIGQRGKEAAGELRSSWQQFYDGFKEGMTNSIKKLSDFKEMGKNAASELASGMQSSFSNLFQGLFKGNIASFSEFMTSIGDLFLKTISDMIAQMIVLFFWQKLTGLLFSGSSTITGGVGGTTTQTAQFGTVWSPSFAEGTDSIPYTGNYRLHEGEKVTPKYDATKSDNMEFTIINQITPEAVATAMSGKEGQGVIVNTINTDALRNGTTRKTIRRK